MKKAITKIYATVFVFLISFSLTFAQGFEKGTKNLNLGLTFGSFYGLGAAAAFDYGITDQISVGVGGSYSNSSNFGLGINYYSISARGAYHLGEVLADPIGWDTSKIDAYLGLSINYRGANFKNDSFFGVRDLKEGVKLGGFAGFRYGFSEKLGAYAELGFPTQSLGVTFKF